MNSLNKYVDIILNKAPDCIPSEYIKSISNIIEENTKQKSNSCIASKNTSKNCFLSVVIRTQGKRNRLLLETLDSLKAQTCQDFEIILVGHMVNDDDKKQLSELVCSLNDTLKEKITFEFLDKGNRTAPLNYGFSLASGKYIAILDDDDVVLPRWVQLFFENDCGKVLHCYCYEQDWKTENNRSIAVSDYKKLYLTDFVLKKQIWGNVCPPHSLAFPSYLFNDFAIVFDETLTTTEDWDYLMRAALFAGVRNIKEPGCIYKKWVNVENSKNVHSKSEWDKNEEALKRKLQDSIMCLSKEDSNLYVKDCLAFNKQLLFIYRKYTLYKVLKVITLGLIPGIRNKCNYFKSKLNDRLN